MTYHADLQTFQQPKTISVGTHALKTIVLSGAFAVLAFDLFGQTISPLLRDLAFPFIGAKLAPVALANQSLGVLTGLGGKFISTYGIGHLMHLITGLLIYPAAYLWVAKPVSERFAPKLPWWVIGSMFGVALWIFALYGMAHVVAGNPPFLGWSGITWVALWGHMIFGIVVAATVKARHG